MGPSASSRARRESSESLEWRDRSGVGGELEGGAYDSRGDVIE
jgi:hypothetical protein